MLFISLKSQAGTAPQELNSNSPKSCLPTHLAMECRYLNPVKIASQPFKGRLRLQKRHHIPGHDILVQLIIAALGGDPAGKSVRVPAGSHGNLFCASVSTGASSSVRGISESRSQAGQNIRRRASEASGSYILDPG